MIEIILFIIFLPFIIVAISSALTFGLIAFVIGFTVYMIYKNEQKH